MKKNTLLMLILFFFLTHKALANSLEKIGDAAQIALPLTGASIAAYQHDWTGLKQLTYAGFATLSMVQLLKYTVHRERPNGHMKSFPSGHTAAAFWGAGFLQMRYGWYYGVPAYALAGITGYSRVQSHNHWTTDVIAGMVIGLGANFIFTRPYSNQFSLVSYHQPERKENGLTLTTEII